MVTKTKRVRENAAEGKAKLRTVGKTKTKTNRSTPAARKEKVATKEETKDTAPSYNKFKEYGGKKYTGMKIGRSHKWYYDQGEWKERKVTPDRWTIDYEVVKRRAGKAPEGSGVPVGTKYHWYILAHQFVEKLDANSYSTKMSGEKFKIAHQRAGNEKWSTTDKTQRKRTIRFLKEMLAELEKEEENQG